MCQFKSDSGEIKSDVQIRNNIYELDGYFTFDDLKTMLESNELSFNSKYISQIINEMLAYNNIEKRGIYFKTVF